jgi:predicted hydrocarbon binding protein
MSPNPPEFVPRSLGISAPAGKDVYEVRLRVESRPSILGKISNVFGSRNVDILGVHGQVNDDKKHADLIFYVEGGASTVPMAQVVDELKAQDFVTSVSSHSRNRVYFEADSFPLTSGGHYRVFAIGADAWAALVRAILQEFESGGKVILREEGTALGKEVVRGMGKRFPSPDAPVLLDNLKALFRASGLGLLEITEADRARRFIITIKEPAVCTRGGETPIDDFLVGVVKGAISQIYARDYKAREESLEDRTMTFELLRD